MQLRTLILAAGLLSACAAPSPVAPRLAVPSGLERVWIEAFGLE